MATLPLDLDGSLGELRARAELQASAPAGTTIGHVHLQVADLAEAEAFYHGVLGFDVMVRGYPGALFVSAGGYHHHLGLNTWHSAGAGPAAPGSVGLRSFEVVASRSGRARPRGSSASATAGIELVTEGAEPRRRARSSGNLVILRCPETARGAGSDPPRRYSWYLGDVAEWLRSGLQSRLHRFDSGRRLARLAGKTRL